MDDKIVVKSVKIDGQNFDNPLPRFEYATRIGTWCIVVEAAHKSAFFLAREAQEVEVEVGMQFGTLRDVGKVTTWQSGLPDVPGFVAKITGNDPMHFVER